MDKKQLIEDGILTQYILGELASGDVLKVEQLLQDDADLQQYVLELETQFEQMSQENAIPPPPEVKSELISRLESLDTGRSSTQLSSPAFWRSGPWRIAASIALIFGLATIWFYTQWQQTKSSLESMRNESITLAERVSTLESQVKNTSSKFQSVTHPDVIPLVLVGNDKLPEAKVVAYMNHKARAVVVNTAALPALQRTQSYQMWADVDGEMINMGLLESGNDLIALEYIEDAESLNITIEPFGGSEHPTVSNLVSYVKI